VYANSNRINGWGCTMRNSLRVMVALLLVGAGVSFADEEGPAGFLFVVGPRLGVSYTVTTSEGFTDAVNELFPSGTYVPVNTLFGVMAEQRILLGETRSHFAFQEVILVAGLEQSIALPAASLMIGYRDYSGFEIGAGPNLSLRGLGVVVAIGWTINARGVYIPIDVSCVLPSQQNAARIALTTGFNFVTRRSSRF